MQGYAGGMQGVCRGMQGYGMASYLIRMTQKLCYLWAICMLWHGCAGVYRGVHGCLSKVVDLEIGGPVVNVLGGFWGE